MKTRLKNRDFYLFGFGDFVKTLIISLVLICPLSLPRAFGQEIKIQTSNVKSAAIINLEGFAPADQITEQNGVIEIGSSDVMDAVTHTLIDQGLMQVPNEIRETIEAAGLGPETLNLAAQNIAAKIDVAPSKLVSNLSHLDIAVQSVAQNVGVISGSTKSTFQVSSFSQNAGAQELSRNALSSTHNISSTVVASLPDINVSSAVQNAGMNESPSPDPGAAVKE